ncbi:SIR2 family protein [Microbacterium sp. PRF11]|uniref:SIR2 family protein n=1 Tax=Microbacterium sp. PRF11 TaxID=2962593 RepID=UPI002880E22D|nr:SIR2 family protein [Microbacterium sp. PRF11]MDT0116629.1 SIR2 family protein [Microbacterium sp. PRF11]
MSAEQFFLRSAGTLAALHELSSADSLVLYCGAGVTINRTGMSWPALLKQVFRAAASNGRSYREKDHAAIELILDALPDEEQRASILTEYFTEGRPEEANRLLTPRLQSALYKDTGWSEGQLLANIARLALVASVRLSGSVTILTTNYDVYLEEAFAEAADELLRERGDEEVKVAGLERQVAPEQPSTEPWPVHPMRDPVATDAVVRIVYLHGRVPRPGGPTEGTVVLDEFSYARSHAAVTQMLQTHLEDAHVLMLGASVTDAPLIQSLVLTKDADSSRRRFALVRSALPLGAPLPPQVYIDAFGEAHTLEQSDVDAILAHRAKHIGVTQLHPISHAQTAQFVEELELSIRLQRSVPPPATLYADAATDISYERRLRAWANEWSTTCPTPEDAYSTLADSLEERISVLLGGTTDQNDALRLELWVRINPRTTNRTLTLYANSTGPLLAPGTRRQAVIREPSTNASVRAFLQGRPLLQQLSDLGLGSSESTRWKTFLSIPLSVVVEKEVDGQPFAASVPCGVITLAGLRKADLFERFHALPLADIETLMETMTATGTQVLRPAS